MVFRLLPRSISHLRALALPGVRSLQILKNTARLATLFVSLPFLVPLAQAACPASFPVTPGGVIETRWHSLGSCSGRLGDAIGPERRNLFTGGLYQDFARGQIVVFDRWANGQEGQMPQFVMLAYVADTAVHVDWDSTSPFSYDYFNVRWDFDGLEEEIAAQHDNDAQQQTVSGSTSGSLDFTVSASGVLRISVEGCDKGFFSSTCNQGFSHPVTVDVPGHAPQPTFLMKAPPYLTSFPTPPQPPQTTRLMDNVGDSVTPDPDTKKMVLAYNCDGGKILESAGSHEGELSPVVAMAPLYKVENIGLDCRNLPDPAMNTDSAKLDAWINQKIRDAKVSSEVGTDAPFAHGLVGAIFGVVIAAILVAYLSYALPFFNVLYGKLLVQIATWVGIPAAAVIGFLLCTQAGDYDMRLVGLIQMRYRFAPLLEQSTKDHILTDLLTAKGPASNRKEHVWLCGIPTIIPESENHVLMTESSRYLTNQLLAEDAIRQGKSVSADNDNEANGLNDWFLGHLQEFMQKDFYEYNARPYSFQARLGIQNLSDYAADPGGAVCWRSLGSSMPPAPRACDIRRGARIVLDYVAAKFAVSSSGLRRSAPFRRRPEYRDYPFLFHRGSDEALFTYLAFANGSRNFWTERYGLAPGGAADEMTQVFLGEFRPSPVITDIMSDAAPSQTSFERFFFQRDSHNAVEVYYRHPDYLISAGGIYDAGRLSFFQSQEDAWSLPTTLMPTRVGLDRREFVSIEGNKDQDDRVNICVAPDFACGENPRVPPGIPSSCLITSGFWTFIDFAASNSGCKLNYGFFVTVYNAPCEHRTCDDHFGFFEVTPWQEKNADTLAKVAKNVLANNAGAVFREDGLDVYTGAMGRSYYFVPRYSSLMPPADWAVLGIKESGTMMLNHDTRISDWPLANGELVHSDKHTGCLIVDNPIMQQRLILDFSDKNHPKRTRVWLPPKECNCPMPERCKPPRYQ